MRKLSITALVAATSFTLTAGYVNAKPEQPQTQTASGIFANQVGFITQGPKTAVIPNVSAKQFTLSDKKGTVVYTGALSAPKDWRSAGETVKLADFSGFTAQGEYLLKVEGVKTPFEVSISNDIYKDALKASIKNYYFNRNSAALEPEYAGIYQRPASHPDTIVYVDQSAATDERPAGTVISSPKGWFDAGDYGKYTVNSAITVHTLLRALENKPELFAGLELNIPESGNKIPDLLDEVLWNLDWMVTMQDSDGGLYHKLTAKRFEGTQMPHLEYKPRFVVQKSTAAALDYAATLAVASRVIAQYEDHFPGRAEQYKASALKAWDWAVKNPNVLFEQPEGFNTGMYRLDGDDYKDEWAWARAELFTLTGKKHFLKGYEVAEKARAPEWSDVEMLGMLALANNKKTPKKLKQEVLDGLKKSADTWVKETQESGYGVPMFDRDFRWGSNGFASNKAMALLDINKLIPNPEYVKAAYALLDYMLGRNPLGVSYLTGFGENAIMNPHHRVSEADGIKEPVPGMLAGGPHSGFHDLNDCKQYGNVTYGTDYPAKNYVDHWCSYATNEIAINWNAAFVYVLTELNQ